LRIENSLLADQPDDQQQSMVNILFTPEQAGTLNNKGINARPILREVANKQLNGHAYG
jgi:hypothetical protein